MTSLRVSAFVLLGFALSCADEIPAEPHFDGPTGMAVLQPDVGGPFTEPVAFVANSRSGRITPLDLKHGRLLSDDLASSFMRASYLPTGSDRILGELAVYAPDEATITLFVADKASGTLLEVPYVIGFDQEPIEVEATVGEVVFVDADGSGDTATLDGLTVRTGYTTTEDWSISYDGEQWWVEGTASGDQSVRAGFDTAYHTDDRELEFTIVGTATVGDRFEVSTDSGIVTHEIGGTVLALAMSPDQTALAASLYDTASGEASLVVLNPADGAVLGSVSLPEGASPYRMHWSADGQLFVSDTALPNVYELRLDTSDVSGSEISIYSTDGPSFDVAAITTDAFSHLAVAPVGASRVDLYDLSTGERIAVNAFSGGSHGLDLGSPVTGIGALPIASRVPQENEWGAQLETHAIAVSLFKGELVLMDAETGCLVQHEEGPYSYGSSTDSYVFTDVGSASDPYINTDDVEGQAVVVNECAGVAVDQTWDIRFDEIEQAWHVEGSRSGEQASFASEDERYVSDEGDISFLILSGASPSTDGDTFSVTVDDGVMRFSGDLDRSGDSDVYLELPGDPVGFWYDAGSTGGGWDQLDRRAWVLWPLTNSDAVARGRVETGIVEIIWE